MKCLGVGGRLRPGGGPGLINPGQGPQQKTGTHSPGRDGLDQETSADLGPGSAVFLLRIVRGSSFKRVGTEWAASGRFHGALWARGQWREVMRSEGPPAPRSASGQGREVRGCLGDTLGGWLPPRCGRRSGPTTYQRRRRPRRLETGFSRCRICGRSMVTVMSALEYLLCARPSARLISCDRPILEVGSLSVHGGLS